MEQQRGVWERWSDYRPSKGTWFWSCVACVIATIVVGFAWGGWVLGSSAAKMADDAAANAKVQLAAAECVGRFQKSADFAARLASLKKTANTYDQRDMIKNNGWATPVGVEAPIPGAAELCAQKLVTLPQPATAAAAAPTNG